VRQSQDAIVSLLTSAGVPAARLGDWRLAENRCHFLLVGRRWWWRHLFVIDKATLGIVASRRWFQMWGE